MTESVGQKRAWKLVLAGCLSLAFVAARVLGAYWMQHSLNSDYTSVVLMAKRIAQGLELPLFFYGQGFMGSLEPILSALLCRLSGFSGFTICMGTAAFSVAMIPFLYLLGRSAGGWQAGMAALVFCVIGPSEFFRYTASPRGGYAALLFFTVFLLWAMLEITWREHGGRRCKWLSYAGVGFAGGIAWWVDHLVSPAIVAGILVYILVIRSKAFRSNRLCIAACGFMAGLIPFFAWNMMNGWQSFDFILTSTHSIDFSKGLRLFFLRSAVLLDLHDIPWYLQFILGGVYLAAFILSAIAFVLAYHRETLSLRSISRGLILLFVVAFALYFSYSDPSAVRTPRYILPLVPVIGLFLGVAISTLAGRPKYAAVVLLFLVVILQVPRLKVFLYEKEDSDLKLVEADQLSDFLVNHDIRALYGGDQEQYLNYYLDERFLVCNSSMERYPPYAESMERARSAAVVARITDVDDLLYAIEAEFECDPISGYKVWHHIDRKKMLSSAIPLERIASVTDLSGEDHINELFDRCLLSGWSSRALSGRPVEIVVTFHEPIPVSGVRILCRPGLYPDTWAMSGRLRPGVAWTEMIRKSDVSQFFWSGGRIYSNGLFYRLEGQTQSQLCSQVKLSFPVRNGDVGVRISELQFYSATTENIVALSDLEKLAVWLERAGILRVYADRWESNQIKGLGACEPVLDMNYASAVQDEGIPVSLDRVTAMVVRGEDAEWTRRVMAGCGVDMLETELGPWTIFHFRDEQWNRDYASIDGIRWVGFGAAVESQKHKGLAMAAKAERAYQEEGASPAVIDQMQAALQVYGNYRPGVGKLAVWMDEAGRKREAAFWRENYESIWKPSFESCVSFGGRARLLGVTPEKLHIVPGGKFQIKYFWECKADYAVRNLGVFVHFKRGSKILFQDDHQLLEDVDALYQPFDEVLVDDRLIVVPYDIEPGDCEVWIGLVDGRARNNRLSPRTDLPQEHKSVRLPLILHLKGE